MLVVSELEGRELTPPASPAPRRSDIARERVLFLAGGLVRSARTPWRLFEAGSRDCASDSRRPDVEERPHDDGVLASARFSHLAEQYESPDTLNDEPSPVPHLVSGTT